MKKLEMDDSRRLTGKNLLWHRWGAVMEVFIEGYDNQQVVDCWQKHAKNLLSAVGWGDEQTTCRIFDEGVSLALSAPADALYAATDINEAAWLSAYNELTGEALEVKSVAELKAIIDEELNPALMALIGAADDKGVPWLTDDDEFSLGLGPTAQVWAIDQLPSVDDLDWSAYKAVPLALITGTNGKSTSVRLTSEIIKRSNKTVGVTSTDFIRVGDHIIDKGDYSGPGGARMLLRNNGVEMALLEVARGGILRRGLPVPRADAALITNIAEDHLGQYGINKIEGLTETKFVVAKALDDKGTLVLNADDTELVRYAATLDCRKCWFSLDAQNPVLVEHMQYGGAVCFVRNGMMVYQDAASSEDIIAVNAVPMTFNGAATHNIQNALGAIALAKSLKVPVAAIKAGLGEFRSDVSDNPGRGNVFETKGAKVIMDFAHNEHSMKAIATTTANMPSNNKWLMLASAGDRSDKEIITMTKAALTMRPDNVVICELEQYLRGRELGETSKLIAQACREYGLNDSQLHYAASPLPGAEHIVERLSDNDLALLLVLTEREQIVELLTN